MEKTSHKGFTLVELIVVITILAVLGTIAFVSFQSYTVYSRDTVRVSNLKNLESGLKIQYTQGGAYAVPDESVDITASGTLIRKQGVFGKTGLRTIRANKSASKDPLTGEYYDYVVDKNLSEYQLVGYMESEESFASNSLLNVHAGTGQIMKILGQDLGVVFSGGVELHRVGANVGNSFDIRNPSGELTIKFDQDDQVTSSSGAELFSSVYNRSKALLRNKDLAKLDESLVLYFDMETTTMSGGVNVLKDRSTYLHNGACYNGGIFVNCGEQGPMFEVGNGMSFDGVDDHVVVGNNDALTPKNVSILGAIDIDNIGKRIHLGKGGGGTGNYYIVIETNGVLRFFYDLGGGRSYVEGSYSSVNDKRGYFFSGVFDGEKAKVYLNGELIGEKSAVGELRSTHSDVLEIGYGYSSLYTEGNIHNVYIYSRALSEKEIKTIYGSTLK